MALSIKHRIKMACTIKDVKLGEIAAGMGMSSSTLTQRLNTGKFSTSELSRIAKIIGCTYNSYFKFGDGEETDGSEIGNQIAEALKYAGMSMDDLGRKMGVTGSAVCRRLITGKFRQDELEKIAEYIGCAYVSEFEFEDGTVI